MMPRLCLPGLLLWLVATGLHAACSVSLAGPDFGTLSSFTVSSSEQQVQANLRVACDRLVNLLTSDSITMTYTSGSNPVGGRATMTRSGTTADAVPVRLCTSATCNNGTAISTSTSGGYTWSGSTLLGLLGSREYVLPVYFRTVSGQSVAAGRYHGTMNLSIKYWLCSVGVFFCLSSNEGTEYLAVTLDMTVTNDCITISAPDVNFGSAPLANSFPVVSQSVSITCTKGSTYSVGINNGVNAVGSVRNMASGSNRLSYEIYKKNGSERWGVSGSERWSSASSSSLSSDGLLRTYDYTAKVLDSQNTPPPGTYTDTLVVDVTF